MNPLGSIFLILACTLSMAASAQWVWMDKDGRKVFSDQSPPADVPVKSILKRPGANSRAAEKAEPAVAAASAPARPTASAPRISGKDKELLEKKKQVEAAEAEKKKLQEEKYALEKADNCIRVKQSKATYDSGVRVSRMNAKGEREFLDDTSRAAETKRLQAMIERDCT